MGRHSRAVVFLFFALFFVLGLFISRDYGISWDEHIQRIVGSVTWEYLFTGNQSLAAFPDRYYGPVFETPLIILEKMLGLTDTRPIYLLRHAMIFFMFFIGVVFFYRICRLQFNSRYWALAGSFFLIASPRIFADSFYNSKDIPFMAVFIVSIYTLIRFLNKMDLKWAALHAAACAVLIDIRIVGVMVPVLTSILFTLEFLLVPINRKGWGNVLVYFILVIALTVLFWPTLWTNPAGEFWAAFRQMSHYPSDGASLYLGEYVKSAHLPWHYLPVWIAVTSPLIYILFFLIGCFFIGRGFIKHPAKFYQAHKEPLIFAAWFFIPMVALIVLKSVLYDAWRQVFFIYPALVLIALIGIKSFLEWTDRHFSSKNARWVTRAAIGVIVLNLIFVLKFMVTNHPFQNIYFNVLAGEMGDVNKRFELDYWGVSYRRALEYILRNDGDSLITVYAANSPGRTNALILPKKERARLVYVNNPRQAKYFLSNYRWRKDPYLIPAELEFYSIKINGAKIMVVYKLKEV